MTSATRGALLAAGLLASAAGCAPSAPGDGQLTAAIHGALCDARDVLLAAQQDDGAWRSEVYGCFRSGTELTPHVMSTLLFLPHDASEPTAAFRRGVGFLCGFVDPNGRLNVGERDWPFPIYSAGSASRVVVLERRTPRTRRTHAAYLAYVRRRQLVEHLGWRPPDEHYGGWGFSMGLPRKPAAGQWPEPFTESNLAATIFGLAALRSARAPADDPAYRKALAFVRRCQNFAEDPADRDPDYDDGGFFFMPGDVGQNKAGLAGTDRFGRRRFASYGTMTADGVRALLCCGLGRDHPRVVAAVRWLERNFSAQHNPGRFAPDREVLRDATYYYWAWAAAHAFLAVGAERIEGPAGPRNWAAELAREVLARRREDGTWVNPYTDAKEDDPLVATPFAAAALIICREALAGRLAPGRRCPVTGAGR